MIGLPEAVGEPPEAASRYQLDHVMPLMLGGAARERSNYASASNTGVTFCEPRRDDRTST